MVLNSLSLIEGYKHNLEYIFNQFGIVIEFIGTTVPTIIMIFLIFAPVLLFLLHKAILKRIRQEIWSREAWGEVTVGVKKIRFIVNCVFCLFYIVFIILFFVNIILMFQVI